MALWLYLHFPRLQLNSIYQDGKQQTEPLIIVDAKNNQVVQLNASAQEHGIKVGMGLATAATLCHELKVKVYNTKIEQELLIHIANWLYIKTADIAFYPPNGLLLRVSTMLSLYQNLTHYWQTLSQHLNNLGFDYYYASAYSPYSAKLLAQQALNCVCDDKDWLLKKIESQALTCTDLDLQLITRLTKVGVKHLADLLELPLPELAKRFDEKLVTYIGRLLGQLQHPIDFYIPPQNFTHYLELYFEVTNQQYLSKPLLKQLRLLERHLVLKDKLATKLKLSLHQRDTDDLTIEVTALQGEYKADKWLALIELNLSSIVLAAPITGLSLTTVSLAEKSAQSRDFFDGNQGQLSAQELTAILSAKLGTEQVRGLAIKADARPEIANFLSAPFAITAQQTSHKLRPTLMLPAPIPLQKPVKVMSAPERIVTGWWDEYQVTRDYFIARSEQGNWLWLFRDHQCRWFVHGLFS